MEYFRFSCRSMKGYLKGKSSNMIFDRRANLKYGNRQFWCTRYFVSIVGKNEKNIGACKESKQGRLRTRQDSKKEYIDSFAGEPVEKGK